MVGSPQTSAHRLRDGSPNLTWRELKSKLSSQYSSIPFKGHATKAFANLQQDLCELLEMYLHSTSELLSKMNHDMGMFQISGLNHYTV